MASKPVLHGSQQAHGSQVEDHNFPHRLTSGRIQGNANQNHHNTEMHQLGMLMKLTLYPIQLLATSTHISTGTQE